MSKIHMTPTGPKPCRVDPSNPKSRGCDYGEHYDSWEEAGAAYEKQLETEYGATSSITVSDTPGEDFDVKVYRHPQQGKLIYVSNGQALAFKGDGTPSASSATAEKLSKGYGRWEEIAGFTSRDEFEAYAPASVVSAISEIQPKPSGAPSMAVPEALKNFSEARDESVRADNELRQFYKDMREYDRLNGVKEGRGYYYSWNADKRSSERIYGEPPAGKDVYYEISDSQFKERLRLIAAAEAARAAAVEAQTRVELLGAGDKLSDEGNAIRVRTQAQKWLLVDELQGQISDGYWENTRGNPWQDWSSAKVIVDEKNLGRNFSTSKDNYQLNSRELLEAVGDRMVENVSVKTGSEYSAKDMGSDLKDLRNIFKTKRDTHIA